MFLLFLVVSLNLVHSKQYDVFRLKTGLFIRRNDDRSHYLRLSSLKNEIDVTQLPSTSLTYEKGEVSADGIFGFYQFPQGPAVVMIKESSPVFYLRDIYEIKELCVIPICPTTTNNENEDITKLSGSQLDAVNLIEETFSYHKFYYSKGNYDFTKNLQTNLNDVNNKCEKTWRTADEKYFWNRNLLHCLIKDGNAAIDDEWILPVTNGWIASRNLSMPGITTTTDCSSSVRQQQQQQQHEKSVLVLISRRERDGQGPRYLKRGADCQGNIAHCVETEQLFQDAANNHLFSFCQVTLIFHVFLSFY